MDHPHVKPLFAALNVNTIKTTIDSDIDAANAFLDVVEKWANLASPQLAADVTKLITGLHVVKMVVDG